LSDKEAALTAELIATSAKGTERSYQLDAATAKSASLAKELKTIKARDAWQTQEITAMKARTVEQADEMNVVVLKCDKQTYELDASTSQGAKLTKVRTLGFHSSTSQLNLSRFLVSETSCTSVLPSYL
jgi:hypothetical protein